AETSIKSAEAAVAIANEEGGILGRNIELTVVDDNGDPTVAITKLRELLNGDSRPDFVMNSGPSPVSAAMVPVLTENEIVSFNITPTEETTDPQISPFNFEL